jgi:hypothetical protein
LRTFGGRRPPNISKNPYMLAFDLNQNSRFGCFRPKMLAICPLIVSERVPLLTLHMFCWHKPHYFIFGETIYRSKIYVLAFDTNENSRFGRFQSKLLAICPFIMSVILLLLVRCPCVATVKNIRQNISVLQLYTNKHHILSTSVSHEFFDNNQYRTKLIQIKDIKKYQHYRVLVVVYIIVLMSSLL